MPITAAPIAARATVACFTLWRTDAFTAAPNFVMRRRAVASMAFVLSTPERVTFTEVPLAIFCCVLPVHPSFEDERRSVFRRAVAKPPLFEDSVPVHLFPAERVERYQDRGERFREPSAEAVAAERRKPPGGEVFADA